MRDSADLIVTVCDATGYVMPGVDVELTRCDGRPIRHTNALQSCTRSDGKAVWESLEPGAYELVVQLHGCSEMYSFDVKPGEQSRTVVFETRPERRESEPTGFGLFVVACALAMFVCLVAVVVGLGWLVQRIGWHW